METETIRNTALLIFFFIFLYLSFRNMFAHHRITKRMEEIQHDLKNYAKSNGFEIKDEDKELEGLLLKLPKIFDIGVFCRLINIIVKNKNERKIYWADHQYLITTGSNKSRGVYINASFVVIIDERLDIPKFFMRDEKPVYDYFGKLVGGQDINFPEDKEFSPAFVLQGESENLVRKFFTAKIRKLFLDFGAGKDYLFSGHKNIFVFHCNEQAQDIKERFEMEKLAVKLCDAFIAEKEN